MDLWLQGLCEVAVQKGISVDNAAPLLHTSDELGASRLREICMRFVVRYFDTVSKSEVIDSISGTFLEFSLQKMPRLSFPPFYVLTCPSGTASPHGTMRPESPKEASKLVSEFISGESLLRLHFYPHPIWEISGTINWSSSGSCHAFP